MAHGWWSAHAASEIRAHALTPIPVHGAIGHTSSRRRRHELRAHEPKPPKIMQHPLDGSLLSLLRLLVARPIHLRPMHHTFGSAQELISRSLSSPSETASPPRVDRSVKDRDWPPPSVSAGPEFPPLHCLVVGRGRCEIVLVKFEDEVCTGRERSDQDSHDTMLNLVFDQTKIQIMTSPTEGQHYASPYWREIGKPRVAFEINESYSTSFC